MTAPDAWKPDPKADERSPYVDWWVEREILFYRSDAERGDFVELSLRSPFSDTLRRHRSGQAAASPMNAGKSHKKLGDQYGWGSVPIPSYAENGQYVEEPGYPFGGLPDAMKNETTIRDLIRTPPAVDAVIVGIIDDGIALGHARFRDPAGSRFLASWQQGGVVDGGASQPYLPFGREVYRTDIENAFSAHSPGGTLDEDAFNRAIGIVDYENHHGVRSADRHVAHGTAVLDLATGYDSSQSDKPSIIAVQLPRRPVVGLGGAFLEYFVIYGIYRIILIADQIWDMCHEHSSDENGFRIVINVSYGQQAGPKDANRLLEGVARNINHERRESGRPPVRLVFPAGNDNLERCHARWEVKPNDTVTIPWRLLPEDQSSNFVEVWSPLLQGSYVATGDCPLELQLSAPGLTTVGPTVGKPDHFHEIRTLAGDDVGRIYCRKEAWIDGTSFRYRYVICAGPTLNLKTDHPAAPSGVWNLAIKNIDGSDPLDVYFHVQVDQGPSPGSLSSGRSYFDLGPLGNLTGYVTHEENGRLRDSYAYPLAGTPDDNLEPANKTGAVQRKGTHNAIATLYEMLVVGGYRASDGRPAYYSATTQGRRSQPPGRKHLTASLPSEDGPMHPGLLAAGTRSASAVAVSGTSFAAALATRKVAEAWGRGESGGMFPVGSATWLETEADNAEQLPRPHFLGKAHELKIGDGRLDAPGTTGRKNRRETS